MDRETIVKFCNDNIKSLNAAMEIIAAYCEDMGKRNEDIALFIQALHIFPMYNSEFLKVALDYFKRKYVIFELYKDNECILTY